MYTVDKIKQNKTKNDLESSKQDIPENQVNTFHVEHKKQISKDLQKYKPLFYNMKKFEAITQNRKEFLFAPDLDEANRLFFQLYGHNATINEVEKTIYE